MIDKFISIAPINATVTKRCYDGSQLQYTLSVKFYSIGQWPFATLMGMGVGMIRNWYGDGSQCLGAGRDGCKGSGNECG